MAEHATQRRAVVLAGGQGTRLRPYTTILPKPLLPVGDRPILERVLRRLAAGGFGRVTISVGHLAELIQIFFGNGEKFGVAIDYAIEATPLGTIGPLPRIADLGDDFLVMNGDILTDLDLERLWEHHQRHQPLLTVATFRREVNIDFGVLTIGAGGRVSGFVEKPTLLYDVSMGAYVLNRRCLRFIPPDAPFGFDQLVLALLAAGEPIQSYLHQGCWLDLGRPEDYERAHLAGPGLVD